MAKVVRETNAAVDKAEKRVEELQNKRENLKDKVTKTSSDDGATGSIVNESSLKTLEEIENRLYKIYDLEAEKGANDEQLKEYIQLYKQYEDLISKDTSVKFDPSLKE